MSCPDGERISILKSLKRDDELAMKDRVGMTTFFTNKISKDLTETKFTPASPTPPFSL